MHWNMLCLAPSLQVPSPALMLLDDDTGHVCGPQQVQHAVHRALVHSSRLRCRRSCWHRDNIRVPPTVVEDKAVTL